MNTTAIEFPYSKNVKPSKILGNSYLTISGQCHHMKGKCSEKRNSLNQKSSRITENCCYCWKLLAELCRTILWMSDHSVRTEKYYGDLPHKVSVRLRMVPRLPAHLHGCRMATRHLPLCDSVACSQWSYYNVPRAALCAHHFRRHLLIITLGPMGLCPVTELNQGSFVKWFLNLLLLRLN